MAVQGSIRYLKERVLAFDPVKAAINSIQETSNTIIQFNQIQLYRYSTDAFGNKLNLYSSPLYALTKERLNPLPGFLHPDLYLKGDFYRGFKVTVTSAGIYSVYSTDSKADKLTLSYGAGIFGLTNSNVEIYARQTFSPVYQEAVTAGTGLAFG